MYSFPYLEPVSCSMTSSNYCFLTCLQISQEAGHMVWYFNLFQNFPQFVLIHIVKGFEIVNKAEIDFFFWNSLAFSVIQRMLTIWSLVPLPFLNPAEHLEVYGSRTVEAWLGEFSTLFCYHVRWMQLYGSLSILWHCLSLGLEWRLTFSSPVATAEFSKFAGILSIVLSHSIIF